MAEATGDFFTGDDLDDLFMLIDGGFLDGDDALNEQIDAIAAEVDSNENAVTGFQCSHCEKVCKTKRGLTRHTNVKHATVFPPSLSSETDNGNSTPPTPLEVSMKKLDPIKLRVMVKICAENIATDLCFPESMRSKFSNDSFSFSNEDAEALWYKLRDVIDSFHGDAEKFYSCFYALFVNNLLPTKFDDNTVTNTLMSELANEMLVHLSGCKHMELEAKDCSLPEKELKSLQYLAGFCIHKLYTKFRFSTNSASAFHNKYCLILHACKVEQDDTQALVNVRDRGGLWKVCKKMQDIFVECEILFRTKTSTFTSSLVCADLVTQSLKNITIISKFNAIALSVDIHMKKEFCINLLEHILTLYFRVRAFSFAKDVREKHKAAKKTSRKRSLRTEIQKASSSTAERH